MPVLVPVIIGAVGAIGGALITSSATKDASQTTAASTAAALDYAKQQDTYARQAAQNRYAALAGAGGRPTTEPGMPVDASGAVEPLPPTSTPAPAPSTVGQFSPVAGAPARNAPVVGTTAPSAGASQLVTMRAPDGSTQQVPANQVQYWMQKGATQVPAGA